MTQSKTNNIVSTNNKSWSVQVSLTGLSFLGPGQSQGALYLTEQFPVTTTAEGLTQYLDQFWGRQREALNIEAHQSIRLVHQSAWYTVVPKDLFDPSRGLDYLKFNTRLLDNDLVAYDVIEALDLVVVYLPFTNVNNWFFERFGSFTFEHSVSVLLRHFLAQNSPQNTAQAMIYLHHNQFDLIVWQGKKLLMSNTYNFQAPQDVLYYVLFGFEQFDLNPEQVPVYLAGAAFEQEPLFELLFKYVRHVSFYAQGPRPIQNLAQYQELPLQCISQ
jgi:hypothetical protein